MDITFENLAHLGSELMAANLANLKNPALKGPGLDDVAFDRMYGFGFRLLAAEQYEQALSVFSFLFAQRPTEPRVLSGFGHSLYGLGDVGEAAMMHSLAYSAEPDNPGHILAMAEDLMALDVPMVTDLLRAAEYLADQTPQYTATAERARALLALMKRDASGATG
jgi:Flp pilus assembly protein TadD